MQPADPANLQSRRDFVKRGDFAGPMAHDLSVFAAEGTELRSAKHSGHKYARVEHERRFLVDRLNAGLRWIAVRRIDDRYIERTFLRLRRMTHEDGSSVYKLTQKLPCATGAGAPILVTTLYVSESEFGVLSQLPAKILSKTRYSVPPFGIDVFDGPLRGLILAEAEFDSAADAAAFVPPSFVRHEVSSDERFTGARLAAASRNELKSWLKEYALTIPDL
jgi:CYTH domain-containing protein